MFKKYISLFLLFIFLLTSVLLYYPQNTLSATDHVVISQIQVGGTNATDEFVELFNPTGSSIDLTGWRLSKKISSGTQSNLITTMSGTINANSYLLLAHTDYDGSTVEDHTYTTSSITANNTMILYSDAGITVVDKVGFGTPFTNEYETAPFPTNPANNMSIQRINNMDTDNNSVDFAVLTPSNARNTSSVVATTSPTATASPIVIASPTTTPTATPIVTATPVMTQTPTSVPTQTPTSTPVATTEPTPTVTASPTPTALPTSTPVVTASPTSSPVATFTASPTPRPTTKPSKHHDRDDDYDFDLPFGFRCGFDRHEFKFKKVQFSYYKFHFGRR